MSIKDLKIGCQTFTGNAREKLEWRVRTIC